MYANIKKLNSKIDNYSKSFDKFLHKLDKILL